MHTVRTQSHSPYVAAPHALIQICMSVHLEQQIKMVLDMHGTTAIGKCMAKYKVLTYKINAIYLLDSN